MEYNGKNYESVRADVGENNACDLCDIGGPGKCPLGTTVCFRAIGLSRYYKEIKDTGASVQERDPVTEAMKFDVGKTDLGILPMWVLEERINYLANEATPGFADRQAAECIQEAALALAEFAQDGQDTDRLVYAIDVIVESFPGGWPEAMHHLAQVRQMGAEKYARNDWQNGFKESRLISASLRHMIGGWKPDEGFIPGFLSGETHDRESGLDHRGHMLFGPIVALDQRKRGAGERDLEDSTNSNT